MIVFCQISGGNKYYEYKTIDQLLICSSKLKINITLLKRLTQIESTISKKNKNLRQYSAINLNREKLKFIKEVVEVLKPNNKIT